VSLIDYVGKMQAGGYSKIRKIGSGSFGCCYLVQGKAKNQDEKRLMVMKEIDVSRMDRKEKQVAENEVKCLSSVKHPYIVRYWESFMRDRFLCIVMDYCEGGDLFQLVQQHKQRGRPIPENNVIQWFTQLSLALKYVHDKSILHRDIKTQNVLLTGKDGRASAKLADFGISRFLDGPNACAQTVAGTPYYLSPEMVQKQPYSWASDVWALGCVLYEMCALRVPFEANDMNQLMRRIVSTNPARIPASYSRDVGELCIKMLSRDASKRPTAATLVQLPLLQKQIKQMLQVSHSDKGENKGENKGDQIDSARDNRDRKPLGEHNHRNPSPASKPVSRAPSPAMQRHRSPSPAMQRHPSPSGGVSPFRCDIENRPHPQGFRDQSPHHGHRAPSPRPGVISPSPRPGAIRNGVHAASPEHWGLR
jgi:serine/threonine protein kinase